MVLCEVVWSMDIGGGVCCIVCVKGRGLGGGSCGGNGGLVMTGGPEMTGIVCVCGVVSVYGLEKGESIWVLIGQMWCLLHMYLQPWASMRNDLGIWAWPITVPSRYEVWSAGLRNKTSCPGSRSSNCCALCLLSWWCFCWTFLVIR